MAEDIIMENVVEQVEDNEGIAILPMLGVGAAFALAGFVGYKLAKLVKSKLAAKAQAEATETPETTGETKTDEVQAEDSNK